MTPEEQKVYQARQRSRSIALAVVLGLLFVLFYLITIAKQV